MARLKDPEIHGRLLEGLAQWNVGRGLGWKSVPAEYLKQTFPRISQLRVGEILYDWVKAKRPVDQVRETRESYCQIYSYHYDFVIKIGKINVYIETVMLDESRVHPPQVTIVSMHRAD